MPKQVNERPVKVWICGQPFIIEWNPRSGRKLHEDDEDYWALGSTAVAEQRLFVREVDQAAHQIRDTVLHEIMHAILKMTGQEDRFAEGGDENKPSSLQSEKVVSAISTALLAVLRANPKLVAWLTEPLPEDAP